MRVGKSCALMMTLCLLLTACTGGDSTARSDDEQALDIRTNFLAMAGCTATLELTADYGHRVYEYNMDLTYTKEAGTVLTVTAPATIAGVTARIADGTAVMEYDGISLETGPLDTGGLSPVGAPPALLEAVCRGYMAQVSAETLGEADTLRVCYRDPEHQPGTGTELTLWFQRDTGLPLVGEISSQGVLVVKCVFKSFQMSQEPAEETETWTNKRCAPGPKSTWAA